jgi:phage-related protein
MSEVPGRPIVYVGRSLKDLGEFPPDAVDVVSQALTEASQGRKPEAATPLRGFRGVTTPEVVEDVEGDAFWAVYTVRFEDAVYVLHCVQRESHDGLATDRQDIELVRRRLAWAERVSEERLAGRTRTGGQP